jgi:hypothetical protein
MKSTRPKFGLPTEAHHRYYQKREKDHMHKLDNMIKSEQLILTKTYPTKVVINKTPKKCKSHKGKLIILPKM